MPTDATRDTAAPSGAVCLESQMGPSGTIEPAEVHIDPDAPTATDRAWWLGFRTGYTAAVADMTGWPQSYATATDLSDEDIHPHGID